MKKYFNRSLTFTILFIISCGDIENGTDGLNTVVDVRDYTGSECSNGGIEINVGLDDDGDGLLSSLEVDNTQYVCNGEDGTGGTNGLDGIDGSQIDVQIVQWTSNGTLFSQNDSPNSGDGQVYTNFYNDGVTSDVILNGLIIVQYGNSSTGPWYGIPTTIYGDDGDGGGVDYIYDVVYSYNEGRVQISWDCSFGRTLSEWTEISSLYETYYKIITIGF